jgi:hypothetical protein
MTASHTQIMATLCNSKFFGHGNLVGLIPTIHPCLCTLSLHPVSAPGSAPCFCTLALLYFRPVLESEDAAIQEPTRPPTLGVLGSRLASANSRLALVDLDV